MIERTVTIKSVEMADAQGGKKQYLSAVLVGADGRESKKAIFDPEMQKTFLQAHKESKPLSIKLEKEGSFWNIKEAQISDARTPVEVPEQRETKTWKARSPSEMHSIERQTKAKEAGMIYRHCTDPIVPWDAELYLKIYRDIAEVMRADGNLIEEAKKLGAKVIDEELPSPIPAKFD